MRLLAALQLRSPQPGQGFSLSPATNDTSSGLDLVRWIAAQAVCIGHAISFFGVAPSLQPPHSPYMQNVGVIVFFVLSGFVIAHTLVAGMARPDGGLSTFIVERVARIYSTFVPGLIIIALVDLSLVHFGHHSDQHYVSWSAFFGTLSMFQNYPGTLRDLLAVPSFGSAGQLWTLSVEFHIYLFVGGLFYAIAGKKWYPAAAVALLAAPVPFTYFAATAPGTPSAGLSYLWLLGFAGYFAARAAVHCRVPASLLWLAVVWSVYMWRKQKMPGEEYSLATYPIVSLAFLSFVLATQRTHWISSWPLIGRTIRLLADYSFSLCLIHYSLLYAMKAVWADGGATAVFFGIIGSNVIALVVASFTEFRHRKLASWIESLVGMRGATAGSNSLGGCNRNLVDARHSHESRPV